MSAELLETVLEEEPKAQVFSSNSELTELKRVNWDFPDRISHSDIEGLHPYPAKFISELPRALLEILPVPPGTAVFDPFCGSGTTLVECQRGGIPSVGVDLNPIACLISRVKTKPLPRELSTAAAFVVTRGRCMSAVQIPTIPNLNHWFLKPVQQALARITNAINAAPAACQDVLRLALSSIIVRVSNQDSDTRYAAVKKSITADEVFCAFERATSRVAAALNARDYPLAKATVLEADTLTHHL